MSENRGLGPAWQGRPSPASAGESLGEAASGVRRSSRRFHLGVWAAMLAAAATISLPARADEAQEKRLPNLVYVGCHGTFHLLGATGTGHYTYKCETYLVRLHYWMEDSWYYYYKEPRSGYWWAFAKHPSSTSCCDPCCCSYAVWFAPGREHPVYTFDYDCLIHPKHVYP